MKRYIQNYFLLIMLSAISGAAQVKVNTYINHINPDGLDSLGNIIVNVSDGIEPYSYDWSAGTYPGLKDRTNVFKDFYTVKIKEDNNDSTMLSYNLGYKAKWAFFNNTSSRNDSLFRIHTGTASNIALSANILKPNENGWVEFVLPEFKEPYLIGFSTALKNVAGILDITFGFRISDNYELDVYYSGNFSALGALKQNDVVTIERRDNDYVLSVNHHEIFTAAGQTSVSLKVKARINESMLMNVGCSFNEMLYDSELSVQGVLRHISPDAAYHDGLIGLKVSGGESPYTFIWNPDITHRNIMTDATFGTYEVTVYDNGTRSASYSYNMGYQVSWDKFNGSFFRNDSLFRDADAMDAVSALSHNTLKSGNDGWMEYVVDEFVSPYIVGFTDNLATVNQNPTDDMDFAFHLSDDNSLYVFSGGNFTFLGYCNAGDVIKIGRTLDAYYLSKNGNDLFTAVAVGKDLKIKAGINSGLFLNLGVSFIRPLVVESSQSSIGPEDEPNSGYIYLNPKFGIPPYHFRWNNSSTESSLSDLGPGTYTVVVSDEVQDSVKLSFTIAHEVKWMGVRNMNVNSNGDYVMSEAGIAGSAMIDKYIPASADGFYDFRIPDINSKFNLSFQLIDAASGFAQYQAVAVKESVISVLRSTLPTKGSTAYNQINFADTVTTGDYANIIQKELVSDSCLGCDRLNIPGVQLDYGDLFIFDNGVTIKKGIPVSSNDIIRIESKTGAFKVSKNTILLSSASFDNDIAVSLAGTFNGPVGPSALPKSTSSPVGVVSLGGSTNVSASEGCQTCPADYNTNSIEKLLYNEAGAVIAWNKIYFDRRGEVKQFQQKNMSENKIIVSQPLFDAYGRKVGQSLPAPVNESCFCYKSNFIASPGSSNPYTYNDFDKPNYNSNPGQLTSGERDKPSAVNNTSPYNLGWYYSNNNTWEKYVPTAQTPYSRIVYSTLDPSSVLKIAQAGDKMQNGSGHESYNFKMATMGELNHAFGPGRGWRIDEFSDFYDSDPCSDIIRPIPLANTAPLSIKSINVDENGVETVNFHDMTGNLIASCLAGKVNGSNVKKQTVKSWLSFTDETQRYIDIHIPDGCENSLTISSPIPSYVLTNFPVYNVIDLKTGRYVAFNGSYDLGGTSNASLQPNLPPGFYRIVVKSYNNVYNTAIIGGGGVYIIHDLNYYNFSLYYYDHANRLKAIVPPKGFDDAYVYSTSPTYNNPSARVRVINSTGNQPSNFPTGKTWSLANDGFTRDISLDIPNTASSSNAIRLSVTFDNKTANSKGAPAGMLFDDDRILDGATASANYDYPEYPTDTTGIVLNPENINAQRVEDVRFRVRVALTNSFNEIIEGSEQESTDLICTVKYTEDEGIQRSWSPVTFNYDQQFLNSEGEVLSTWNKLRILKLEPMENTLGLEEYSQYAEMTSDLVVTASAFKLVASTVGYPQHKMIERFRYDSWGNLLCEILNDKGRIDYNYRKDGLIGFSQNAKQRAKSPTLANRHFRIFGYDDLGRPTVNGTDIKGVKPSPHVFQSYDDAAASGLVAQSTITYLNTTYVLPISYPNYPNYANDCIGIRYDSPDNQLQAELTAHGVNFYTYPQRHLGGRVSHTYNFSKKTWYSYDERGRLEWVIQLYLRVDPSNTDILKTFRYTYDAAGNISEMVYNGESSVDGMRYIYEYDDNNRLKRLYMQKQPLSSPKVLQAKYDYYLHGPLKRIELGDKMQGQDFVYTINGWLKNINSAEGAVDYDPGKDGSISTSANTTAYKDLFGSTLEYYEGDYERNGTNVQTYKDIPGTYLYAPDQFNGIIKGQRWTTNTPSAMNSLLSYANRQLMYGYQYDKKYQLLDAKFAEVTSNSSSGVLQPSDISTTNDYRVYNLSYDYSGNILSLKRNAYSASPFGQSMDDMTYNYYPCKNTLHQVSDAVTTSPYGSLEFKPGQTNYNYGYTETGELALDLNNLKQFEYNDNGNIIRVKDHIGNVISEYDYDEMGYRIQKSTYISGSLMKFTLYVRDANGNVITTFDKTNYGNISPYTIPNEWSIYTDRRLGVLDNTNGQPSYIYELTDHLGNVRATLQKQAKTTITNDFNTTTSTNDDNWFNNPNNTITNAFDINFNFAYNYFIKTQKTTGKEYGAAARLIPVKSGNNITISWKALWETGALPLAGIEVKLTDANGNQLNGANGLSYYPMNNTGGTNNWQSYSQTFNITANYPDMYISVYPRNKDNSGQTAFFDDISIVFNTGNIYQPGLLNVASYYPQGSIMPGLNYNSSYKYKYGYQGQFSELDEETNENSFELRNYNALLGRFTSPDPYNQFFSPYMAMANSHPNQVDPDGGFSYPGFVIGMGVGLAAGVIASEINYASGGHRYSGGALVGIAVAGGLIGSGVVSLKFAGSLASFGLSSFSANAERSKYSFDPDECKYDSKPRNKFHIPLPHWKVVKNYQFVEETKVVRTIKGRGISSLNRNYRISIPPNLASTTTYNIWGDQFIQPNIFNLTSTTGMVYANGPGNFNTSIRTFGLPGVNLILNVQLVNNVRPDLDKWDVVISKTYLTRKTVGRKLVFKGWR